MKVRHLNIKVVFITVILFFRIGANSQILHIPFYVSQVNPINVSLGKDTTICPGANLLINPIVNGGALPYNFIWNTGCSGNSCTVTSEGAFSVTVSDANGCTATDDIIVNLNNNNLPVILDTIPNQSICQGKSISFIIKVNGTDLNFQWTKGGTYIIGETKSTYYINSVNATDYDFYSCIISNTCNSIQLPAFILKVNSPPISNTIFVKQLKYPNDSTTYTLSPEGTSPFSFQWIYNGEIINGATNSFFTINPITCTDSGLYSCKIANSCDSIFANIAQLYVLDCSKYKYTLFGFIRYDNKDSTPMSNTNVYLLNNGDTIIKNTTTDNNGFFVFINLYNGTYKLTCNTSKAWGGVNPVDALIVNRTYIKLYSFKDLLLKQSADINEDLKINPTDALLINRRYIKSINSFNAKDWLFNFITLTINDKNLSTNIRAVCAGDVNGSYIPK